MLVTFFIIIFISSEVLVNAYRLNPSTTNVASIQRIKNKSLTGIAAATFDIFTREFELTDSLKERVELKIGKAVGKLAKDALSTHVVLRMHKQNPTEMHTHNTKKDSNIAEVTVGFKGGAVIHASERSESMHASIDILSHKLAKALRRHHEKVLDKRRKDTKEKGATAGKAVAAAKEEMEELMQFSASVSGDEDRFDEDSLLADLEPEFRANIMPFRSSSKIGVVRPKYFPMPPISVDEAVHQLDLIDHPFYVFRNKECANNEINVVYRRDHGGVGLIMPGK